MENEFKQESYKIAQKLLALFVLITFLSWISAGYMAFYHAADITKQAIINNLISISQNKAHYISKYFKGYKEYLSIISMNMVVKDSLQELKSLRSIEELRAESIKISPEFKRFCRTSNLDEVLLISPDGKVLFSLEDKNLIGLNLAEDKLKDAKLRHAYEKGKASSSAMTNFIPEKLSQKPYAYVTSWVKINNKFAGILAAKINSDEISNIINNTKVLGSKGELLIGSRYNDVGYFICPDPEGNPPISVKKIDMKAEIPMSFALHKSTGFGYFKDYRNNDVLADWRYLPDLDWGIVVKIDKSYAFQPVYRLEKWFLLSGLLAIGIVSVVALLTAKSIVTPLRKINIAITEKAAEALRKSEKKYRTLFETANDGILLIENELIIDCNQKALKMFGLENKKEIAKKSPLEFTAKEQFLLTNAEALAHQYITAALEGEPQRFNWRHVKKNGTLFDVEVALNQLELNNKHYVQAIVRDITEQKQATEALRESERRFFNMSQNVPGMVHHCKNDSTWTMEFVSEGCLPLTGYRTSELLFNRVQSFNYLIFTEDRDKVWDQVQIAIEKHKSFDLEYRINTKSGDIKWVNERGVGVYSIEGKLLAIEGIIFDINRRKNYEHELKTAHNILEQRVTERTIELKNAVDKANAASKAKSSFLSMMSHEIRTPMNAILGFTQLMRRDSNLTEQQGHNLDVINRSGEHLLALINDVLEISKIEAGRSKITRTEFNLKDMLEDMAAMFKIRTEDKNLWLKLNIAKKIPEFIIADAGKIRQIMINLIGNAVKFTNKGGVEIKAYSRKSEIPNDTDHQIFIIEVNDTGCGISQDQLNIIFAPFEQADRDHWQEGTGLGLPISLQYAKLMGGDITVTSTEELGSSFSFQFSAKIGQQIKSKEKKKEKVEIIGLAKTEKKYNILVADDNDTNRQVLTEMLKAFGFDVSQVENGKIALEEFKKNQYDAVLLDQHMPEMDGLTAASKIKDISSTPIIIVTASAMESHKHKLISKCSDEYICKPYRQEDILFALERLLGCKFDKKTTEPTEKPISQECSSILKLSEQHKKEMINAIQNGKQAEFKKLVKNSPIEQCQIEMLIGLADRFAYEEIIDLLSSKK